MLEGGERMNSSSYHIVKEGVEDRRSPRACFCWDFISISSSMCVSAFDPRGTYGLVSNEISCSFFSNLAIALVVDLVSAFLWFLGIVDCDVDFSARCSQHLIVS